MKERKLFISVLGILALVLLAYFKVGDSGTIGGIVALAVGYMGSNVSLKGMGKEP